jgi:hypothetical protein
MFQKIPPTYTVTIVVAILLSGPITVFSFLFGGVNAGVAAILAIVLFFLALYIIIVRKFG